MEPLFVTFEGLDGSGKSTQLRRAVAWLHERGIDPVVTHEPGGTRLGERLREVVLHGGDAPPADELVELLLLLASRRQHVVEVIAPALAAGRVVLCDRFSDSTWAYQGGGRGIPAAAIAIADGLATGGLEPNLTLLFDIDDAEAERRREGAGRGGEKQDRLEREAAAFHRRVRRAYLDRAQSAPQRIAVLDGGATVDQLAERVEGLLGARLGIA